MIKIIKQWWIIISGRNLYAYDSNTVTAQEAIIALFLENKKVKVNIKGWSENYWLYLEHGRVFQTMYSDENGAIEVEPKFLQSFLKGKSFSIFGSSKRLRK